MGNFRLRTPRGLGSEKTTSPSSNGSCPLQIVNQRAAVAALPIKGPDRRGLRSFSLVEVVIAVGIFSFCVVSLISLIGLSLSSSRDTKSTSAVAAALRSIDANVRAIPLTTLTNLTATNYYFDIAGNTTSNNAANLYYQATVTRISSNSVASTCSVTNGNRFFLWSVNLKYPPPKYTSSYSQLLGNVSYEN
jgi:uncharacterized protein (TIGR02598 family)